MDQLLDAALSAVNIPFTVLFVLVLLYWITVIIGLLDIDSLDVDVHADADFDFDADLDVDADIDVDADLHLDADTHVEVGNAEIVGAHGDGSLADVGGDHGGMLNSLLLFANLGYIPFMIVFSFMVLFLWTGAILLNFFFNPELGLGMAVLLFVPNFIVSFIVMKLITWPLKKLFYHMRREEREIESIVGRVCVLTMDASPERLSQATVARSGVPHLLNVRPVGDGTILRGSKAVVVSYIEDESVYLVQPVD